MSPVPVAYFEVKNTSPQEIYSFIKSFTDACDTPLRVDFDLFDGSMGFGTALQTIIDDTYLPIETRQQATAMYNSEHIRGW